jgi:CheY-like chemotaxis protein/HPt (histidine-containing phosphotransfer) domain-containing protein
MTTDTPNPLEVLLIDDDTLSRELLSLLLTAEGYAVQTAESGADALAHLQSASVKPPHVILTDLQMPGITGTELAQRLRATCEATGAPQPLLLAMSGSEPQETIQHSFDGFLLKPFTMQDFASAVSAKKAAPAVPNLATAAQHPVALDELIYKKLADSMPSEQLQQLYALCLGDAEGRVTRMRAAATNGDDASYRREAHAIKGGTGMLGAIEIHSLAAHMEAQGLGAANHVASLDEMLLSCNRLKVILVAR